MGTVDSDVVLQSGREVQSRIGAKRYKPLYTQFRAQKERLSLTNQRLAHGAEVALTTVARELGLEPSRPMSLRLAQRLGDTLGFDPAHVALVHARDVAFAQERSATVRERSKARFRRIRKHLDGYLRQQNPLTLMGSRRRLAALFERYRRRIPLSRLARHTRERTNATALHLSRYERGLVGATDQVVAVWAEALSELAPNEPAVTLSSLDELAESLAMVHHISDTLELRDHGQLVTAGHRLLCPGEPGYEMSIGTSPTSYDSVEVKLVRAVQSAGNFAAPRPSGAQANRANDERAGERHRSPMRIIGALSRGIQIGVLVKGAAELILSRAPFPAEAPREIPDYRVGENGVFHKRRCRQGDVVFLSGRTFRRLEFQAAECVLVIISIRGNLMLVP